MANTTTSQSASQSQTSGTVSPVPITVARGDGMGPESMQGTLDIILAAGAKLSIQEIEIGEQLYKKGVMSGIEDSSWDSIL